MYIETRYHDDGKVEAKLHKGFAYPQLEDDETVDRYVESIGKSEVQADHDDSSDYETLQDWIEELKIDTDDVIPLVLKLENGGWVNISDFC